MVGKGRAPPSTSEQDQQRSQVFVRNLPLTLLEPELETLFGEHGPLKRIDLIKSTQDGVKTSKGFAFIKFALEGDAARAVAAINGTKVQGRTISAEIALKKGTKQGESSNATGVKTAGSSKAKPAAAAAAVDADADADADSDAESGDDEGGHAPPVKQQQQQQVAAASKRGTAAPAQKPPVTAAAIATAASDAQGAAPAKDVPVGLRTVRIFGVAPGLGKNALRKRLRKATTIESVVVDGELAEGQQQTEGGAHHQQLPLGCTATVVCVSREGPSKLIDKLDGHTIHEYQIHIRRSLEVPPPEDTRAFKKHRLIVRNLPWAAAEADLIAAFSAFGPIVEVHIPRVEVTFQRKNRENGAEESVTKQKSRGFGFVQYICSRDAAKVVREHGVVSICGRDAAVDYAVAKKRFEEIQQTTSATATATALAADDDDVADDVAAAGDDVSDDDDVTADVTADSNSAAAAAAEHSDDSGSASDTDTADASDHDAEDSASDAESEQDQEESEQETATVTAAKKPPQHEGPRKSDVGQGQTVFVRNLPFDADQDLLQECFSVYGTLRMAILVKDKETGMPKGTAFVKFQERSAADKCLAAAEGVDVDDADADGNNDSLAGGNCIYMSGRALHVVRAVDKSEAGRLSGVGPGGEAARKDKRNLYLANEGLLIETEEAAQNTPKTDMEKRAAARADKKQKLKNPLFFISPLRLSVRNLGRNVTDAVLKQLFVDAAKSGLAKKKATTKDMRRYLEASGEEWAAITPEKCSIPPVTQAAVVKARVIRDMERKAQQTAGGESLPVSKTGDLPADHPSKGYGFVEFKHHAHALAALRELNNNPNCSHVAKGTKLEKGEKSRLIIEFAVENHAKLKLQETRKAKQEGRKRELASLGLKQDGTPMQPRDSSAKSNGKSNSKSNGSEKDVGTEKKLSRGQRQRENARLKRQAIANGTAAAPDSSGQASSSSSNKGKKRGRSTDDSSTANKRQNNGKNSNGSEDPELARVLEGTVPTAGKGGKNNGKKRKKSQFEKLDKDDKRGVRIEEAYKQKVRKVNGQESNGQESNGSERNGGQQPTARWFE